MPARSVRHPLQRLGAHHAVVLFHGWRAAETGPGGGKDEDARVREEDARVRARMKGEDGKARGVKRRGAAPSGVGLVVFLAV